MDGTKSSYDQYRARRDPKPPSAADAAIGWVLSWGFVLVGVAALAAAALFPAYLETLDLQDERVALENRAQALAADHARYQQFHDALADDDPVLIERLALTELRLRPAGTAVDLIGPRDLAAVIDSPNPDAIRQMADVWVDQGSVEQWLSRPDLIPPAPEPAARPRRTRLLTYATGEHRPWVAGFGALMLMLGLWPRRTAAARPANA